MAVADPDDFDRHVRRVDPDRWLASRLIADPAARTEVLALYALDDELARIAPSVSQPMLGEIRLQWWREALERAARGGAADHPAIEALAPALVSGRLALASVEPLIDGHARDLAPQPFADEAGRLASLDARFGAVMLAAARLLDPGALPEHVLHAARAWGWSVSPLGGGGDPVARVRGALAAARPEVKALPTPAFPAVAHVTLALRRAASRPPSELRDRVALIWAAARGAV